MKSSGFVREVIVKDSSVISKLEYSFADKILRIHFRDTDSIWDYEAVRHSDFMRLAGAYSVGEEFNARIKNRFNCVRIEPVVTKKIPAKIVVKPQPKYLTEAERKRL